MICVYYDSVWQQLSMPALLNCIIAAQGSHMLEKALNLKGCLEKALKMDHLP